VKATNTIAPLKGLIEDPLVVLPMREPPPKDHAVVVSLTLPRTAIPTSLTELKYSKTGLPHASLIVIASLSVNVNAIYVVVRANALSAPE
jgi:hypothetical protein